MSTTATPPTRRRSWPVVADGQYEGSRIPSRVPTVLDIPNGLARGVRAASDFLMALQLTGAAKHGQDHHPARGELLMQPRRGGDPD